MRIKDADDKVEMMKEVILLGRNINYNFTNIPNICTRMLVLLYKHILQLNITGKCNVSQSVTVMLPCS